MIFQDFWNLSFWDLVVLGISIFIPIIINKMLDKKKEKNEEKKEIKPLFLRIKKLFETILKNNPEEQFIADLPYLLTQTENLIKIGVIPKISESKRRTALHIVNEYIFIGVELILMNNQRLEMSKENFEIVLQKMINYAKEYYEIKLSKKLSKFDF